MTAPAATTCTTIVGTGLCGEPTPIIVTTGCVHEHFETGPMCDHHRGQLDAERLGCPSCHFGAEAHECVIRGLVAS